MTRVLMLRSFAVPLELRDADDKRHEAYGRVVPYGEIVPFVEDGEHKRERFVLGALADAARAWHRVVLYYGHELMLPNRLGHGIALEERSDGAYSRFRIDANVWEKALDVLSSTHTGLSLGFYSLRARLGADGVIDRLRVLVDHVAAVDEPAYLGAQLLYARGAEADPGANPQGEEISAQDGSEGVVAGTVAGTPRLNAVLADIARWNAPPQTRAAFAEMERQR